jgi:peptidoglycan/LPS O-acetylase OafA/YrhL
MSTEHSAPPLERPALTTPPVPASGLRNGWLDVARGLAAAAVTLFHFNEPIEFENNPYQVAAKYGWLGVISFFVISGFCVRQAACRSASPGDFFWRRLTRIYPPYLASLVVVGAVCVLRKFWSGSNDVAKWPADWQGWLATITVMTKPATTVKGVNWVYWSLTYEVVFYFVLGLTLWLGRFATPYLFLIAALSCLPDLAGKPGLFFLSYWWLFGLGIALWDLVEGKRLQATLLLLLSVAAFAVRYAPAEVATGAAETVEPADPAMRANIRFGPAEAVTAAGTALLIIGSSRFPGWWSARLRPLEMVGLWSYSLYLLHVPIGVYVLLRFRRGPWLESLTLHILFDLFALAICIVLSSVFFLLVEKPSIELGRRGKAWFGGRKIQVKSGA